MWKKLENYDEYVNELKSIKINTEFDVPYFAGYNWDGNVVYIDKDAPKFVTIKNKRINLHFSLALHEYVEKHYINKGYTYAAAHEMAISYEKQYVKSKHIKWKDYDRAVAKLMHVNYWISKLRSIPEDLDMTPMEYSRDIKTLAKVRRLHK